MKPKITILSILLLILSGCLSVKPIYYTEDRKLAANAIEAFRDSYNREDYREIFDHAHPNAKANKSPEILAQVLSAWHSQMGAIRSIEVVDSKATAINGNERRVEMLVGTQFEKDRRNILFLIISDGNLARLHTFSIVED